MVCLWELYWGKVCSISIKVKQLWSAGFSTILWWIFSLLLTLFELLKEAITRDSIFATIRKKVCFSVRLITQEAWYLSTQFSYVQTFFFRNCNYFLSINDILVVLQSYCLLANFRLTNMLLQPKMHFYAVWTRFILEKGPGE